MEMAENEESFNSRIFIIRCLKFNVFAKNSLMISCDNIKQAKCPAGCEMFKSVREYFTLYTQTHFVS